MLSRKLVRNRYIKADFIRTGVEIESFTIGNFYDLVKSY